MNWYKQAQKVLPSLRGLAYEALKYPTFEEFEKAFCGEIRHGQYWHFTDNPNFLLDPEKGPRDMSSMSVEGIPTKGKLMITSHPDLWDSYYNYSGHGKTRPYVAEIDMSQAPKELYWQVNRGFGNEFWVDNISQVSVIRILSVEQARRAWQRRHKKIPCNEEELRVFYEQALQLKEQGKL